jgi:hypothetical protein
MLPSLPPDELKQLAVDFKEGRVFSDRHVTNPQDISMVFLVLLFMDKEDIDQLKQDNLGMIFEYISKAGPRAVNGMPMFTSARYLNRSDTKLLFEMVTKLETAEKEALAKL